MREPVAIGFYPGDQNELERIVLKLLQNAEKTGLKRKKCMGLVAPHAGFAYCGRTLGRVYNAADTESKNFLVLGTNHSGQGFSAALSNEDWKTPLGPVKVNKDIVNKISSSSQYIMTDEHAHKFEHSIEVQLPFIQKRFGSVNDGTEENNSVEDEIKIIPLSMSHVDKEMINNIAKDIAMDDVFYIASSDLTHFGSMYGYMPVKGSAQDMVKFVKDTDMKMIKLICDLDAEGLVRLVEDNSYTACGYIPIAIMLKALKELGAKRGELVDYTTSYEISRNRDAIVGYAGIIIY